MGYEIRFYCGLRPLGETHFASMTLERQQRAYGVDWFDCLSYDVPGGGECIGDPNSEELEGYFVPNWQRGLERARKLLKLTEEHPLRSKYDVPKVQELIALMERCVSSTLLEYCRVRVS